MNEFDLDAFGKLYESVFERMVSYKGTWDMGRRTSGVRQFDWTWIHKSWVAKVEFRPACGSGTARVPRQIFSQGSSTGHGLDGNLEKKDTVEKQSEPSSPKADQRSCGAFEIAFGFGYFNLALNSKCKPYAFGFGRTRKK